MNETLQLRPNLWRLLREIQLISYYIMEIVVFGADESLKTISPFIHQIETLTFAASTDFKVEKFLTNDMIRGNWREKSNKRKFCIKN